MILIYLHLNLVLDFRAGFASVNLYCKLGYNALLEIRIFILGVAQAEQSRSTKQSAHDSLVLSCQPRVTVTSSFVYNC